MPEEYLILGPIGILFLFAMKEFFAYLKSKKNGNGFNQQIFEELRTMNTNHLHDIRDCIETGNRQLIDTIHDDNTKIIEILGRIDGKLSK